MKTDLGMDVAICEDYDQIAVSCPILSGRFNPHCYEEAKISGQRDLFMLSARQILFLTNRKHLIAPLPIFTRSLALPQALDRVSPSKFDGGLKSAHSRSNGDSQANSTVIR